MRSHNDHYVRCNADRCAGHDVEHFTVDDIDRLDHTADLDGIDRIGNQKISKIFPRTAGISGTY